MICPEYFYLVDHLMNHCKIDVDLTEVDIVEFLISAMSEAASIRLASEYPETFYSYSSSMVERSEAQMHWDKTCYYKIGNLCAQITDDMSEAIEKFLTDYWDYPNLLDTMLDYSDLGNKNSPAIQYYHKLIEQRDSNLHPSFALPYIFGYFVKDLTDLLTDRGYFGTGIPRVEIAKIPDEFRIPF